MDLETLIHNAACDAYHDDEGEHHAIGPNGEMIHAIVDGVSVDVQVTHTDGTVTEESFRL